MQPEIDMELGWSRIEAEFFWGEKQKNRMFAPTGRRKKQAELGKS